MRDRVRFRVAAVQYAVLLKLLHGLVALRRLDDIVVNELLGAVDTLRDIRRDAPTRVGLLFVTQLRVEVGKDCPDALDILRSPCGYFVLVACFSVQRRRDAHTVAG